MPISLIFLVREFRATSLATRVATFQSLINAFSDLQTRISQDAESARIYNVGTRQTEELSDQEHRQFNEIMATTFNLYEAMYYQFSRGLLEPTLWAGWCLCMRKQLGMPGVASWWEEKRHFYSKAFNEYVDSGKCPDT